MGGHDGVVHLVVGQFLGAGLDHDDLALGGGHSQVELGGVLLLVGGVEDNLAVHIAHLHAADGTVPGNIRQADTPIMAVTSGEQSRSTLMTVAVTTTSLRKS